MSESESNYDTVTVAQNNTKMVTVRSDETLANKMYDISSPGASVNIDARGKNWTIKNVGIKGQAPGTNFLLKPAVGEGGSATIKNLYMADGQKPRSQKGGIWVIGGEHYGTLNFQNVNVQGFVNNGLYGTDPGYPYHNPGHGGVVNVKDSLFANNNIANIRVGSKDGRVCTVDNCVVRITGDTPPLGQHSAAPGAVTPRGIWAWWGPVEVKNSDIGGPEPKWVKSSYGGQPVPDAEIRSHNTRYGSDANTQRTPSGVPRSAAQAASGAVGGGGRTGLPGIPEDWIRAILPGEQSSKRNLIVSVGLALAGYVVTKALYYSLGLDHTAEQLADLIKAGIEV